MRRRNVTRERVEPHQVPKAGDGQAIEAQGQLQIADFQELVGGLLADPAIELAARSQPRC